MIIRKKKVKPVIIYRLKEQAYINVGFKKKEWRELAFNFKQFYLLDMPILFTLHLLL